MSRRVLVAQEPLMTARGERVVVPVMLVRDAQGFSFAIELSSPLAPDLTVDAAHVPEASSATERGVLLLQAQNTRDLVRLSIGNAKGEWLATRAIPPLEPLEIDTTLEPRGWIEVQRAGDRLVMCLPNLTPRLVFEEHAAELRCEAAVVDLDRQRVTLRYRARAEVASPALLAFAESTRPSHMAFALEPHAAEETPDPAELALARMSFAHEPVLSFPIYVRAAAKLMEPGVDRARVLEELGLGEDDWLAEENAWLERMGNEAMHGDPSLALAYGELLAQERSTHPTEERSIEQYARIRVELERLGDPERVLAEHHLSLPGWFRLDAHWESAASDPEIAARLERLLDAEHTRLDARERSEERA